MVFKGYKCFNGDLTNRYGAQFEVGKEYQKTNIKFGNDGHGYHMCKNLVDTFRFFDSEDCVVAEVTGWGKYEKYDDDYYGYDDMYAFEHMRIERVLSRDDIIEIMLNSYTQTVKRFIQTFKLTPEEVELFHNKFNSNKSDDLEVLRYLLYYCVGDTDVFNKNRSKEEMEEVYEAWTKSLSKEPEKTI